MSTAADSRKGAKGAKVEASHGTKGSNGQAELLPANAIARPWPTPTKAGLYWVQEPAAGRMIAVVEGVAPFLEVILIDPWERGANGRIKPTAKQIAALLWEMEIQLPPE
jgi:hypothetical protein